MELWATMLLAALAIFLITALWLVLGWLVFIMFYVPTMEQTLGSRMLIGYTALLIAMQVLQGLLLLPSTVAMAALQFLAIIRGQFFYICALSLLCTGGYVLLEYQPQILSGYMTFRQCGARPVVDFFLFPVINILRMIYNAGIQIVNFWTNLYAFYEYGLPITLFKCGLNVELTNIFVYGAQFLYAVFDDFNVYFQSDIFHDEWNIENAITAFGVWLDSFVPIMNCLCAMLDFVWTYIVTFFQLPDVAVFGNYVFNFFLSIAQLMFNTVLDLPAFPNFGPATLLACGSLESGGQVFEDFVFLTLEVVWGVLSNTPNLPPVIAQILSLPYTQIVTYPACAAVKVVNMTAVLVLQFPEMLASDGSGVKYFQFGFIVDELRVAAIALGSLFTVFNNDAQVLATQVALAALDVLAFLLEWVIGNIFYFFYGGPLPASWGSRPAAMGGPIVPPYGFPSDFIRYYFVDYWLKAPPLGVPVTIGTYTYASSLAQFFGDIFLVDQALANLLSLVNDPFGQMVRYIFDAIWAVVLAGANFVSFVYCLITFQCDAMPITFHNVNFDAFFNQLYFLAGAMGDSIRQFDPNACTVTPQEGQKDLVCCAGNLVETLVDTIVEALQQIVHFVQDFLTLPTLQLHLCIFGLFNATNRTQCVRIPNFANALYELDTAILEFSCALCSLIPTLGAFQCQFPPPPTPEPGVPPQPPKQCAKVQSCMANVLASVIQLVVVPLQIMNALFVKTLNGQFFVGWAQFLQFSFLLILGQLAEILSNFGLMLDCLICAFTGTHTNCASPIYEVLYEFGQLLISVAEIFTNVLLSFATLLLSLTVGLFSGKSNPVTALINFVVGVFNDIFGGIGTTVIKVLVGLFNSLGLGIVGQFINIIWMGFCPVLQAVLTVVIAFINLFTADALNLAEPNFCCGGGNCTVSGAARKRQAGGGGDGKAVVINGTWYADVETWFADLVQFYAWPQSDWCNASMAVYATMNFTSLTTNQQGEMMFCFFKDVWFTRTDGQYSLGNSTCDALVSNFTATPWGQIPLQPQWTLIECCQSRLITEVVRLGTNQTWIPEDILTNPWRKWFFAMDLLRGYLINWQYMSDQQKPVTVILSADYQAYWASFALSTAMYGNLQTADDVANMRVQWRLAQYFAANNAPQYPAVLATATGFWSLVTRMFESVQNATNALADDESNPLVYLNYNYSLDNLVGASQSSVMNILSNLFKLVTTFTSYWSNPASYRKRSAAYGKLTEGVWAAFNASRRQIGLMSEEYMHGLIYAGQLRANECGADGGECPATAREALHDEYERSIRGLDEYKGETSIVYKLSKWWERSRDTLFQTYVIPNPRYGTNRSSYGNNALVLEYRAENGTMVRESYRSRVWRYLSLINRGTPAAQRRWQTATTMYNRVKAALFTTVLKHTAQLETIERVYTWETGERKTLIRPRDPNEMTHEIVCDGTQHCEVRLPERYQRHVHYDTPFSTAQAGAAPDASDTQYDYAVTVAQRRNLLPATESRSMAFVAMLFATADIFTITCYTNITINCVYPFVCNGTNTTTLCQQCLYLDQLIGRVTAATDQLLAYYLGGPFSQSVTLAYQFFVYCFDPSAEVVVGNSTGNQVGTFPLPGDDILHGHFANDPYFNDPGPKLRFNDIAAAIDAALNITNMTNPIGNTTLGPGDSVIDDVVLWFLSTVFWYMRPIVVRVFYFFASPDVLINGEGALAFLIDWFILCDWLVGDDYSCANKRFSIGEMTLIYTLVAIIVQFVTISVWGFNCFSIITGTSLSLIIILDSFLSLYANWSALCAPGLPVCLMNDILYFLAYTAFPKCPWLFGSQIKEDYNNHNCYACGNNWTFYSCRNDMGFVTFVDNLIFITQEHFPSVLAWIRETRTPVYILYQIPAVNTRLNEFANKQIDAAHPRTFARYYFCNWLWTFVPNLDNATLFLILFYAGIYPLVQAAWTIGVWALNIFALIALMLFYVILDFVFIIGSTPYDRIEFIPVSGVASPPSTTTNPPSQGPTPLRARVTTLSSRRRRRRADEDDDIPENDSSSDSSSDSAHDDDDQQGVARIAYHEPETLPVLSYEHKRQGLRLTRVRNFLGRMWDNLLDRERKDK